MKKNLTDILGDALPKELVASLQEAFDQKLAEARSDIDLEVREDYARRYEHDRDRLIEAVTNMVTDTVKSYETQRAEEIAKLEEARVKYHTALVEGRKSQVKRVAESLNLAKNVISTQLSKEIVALREQNEIAVRKTLKLAEELKEAKREVAAQHERHIIKIDEFVKRSLSKELVEFHEDKRALHESRVKLHAESRAKLAETQKHFVAQATKNVAALVKSTLNAELTQLHEDLEISRQNMFGRRIFEAVAAEYMTSYLAEGTEVRKLQKVLESKNAEIAARDAAVAEAKARIDEAQAASEVAMRKASIAMENAERAKIMSELLANLKGDKRSVMESLLETTKTSALRKDFDKYLTTVLNEDRRKKAPATTVISETRAAPKVATRSVTGNAERTNRLLEAKSAEDNEVNAVNAEESAEIARFKRLAGVND